MLALAALAGCASPTLRQGAVLGTGGVEYADALLEFLDVYLDLRIDANSWRALKDREERLGMGAAAGAELPATLGRYDEALAVAVRETGRIVDNVHLTRAYFASLEVLSTSDAPDDAGVAIRDLGSAIADVNRSLAPDASRLTTAQLASVGRAGTVVIKVAASAAVRDALQRDREVIAWQLAWQESVLRALGPSARDEFQRQLVAYRQQRLAAPYAVTRRTPELGATWMNDRRRWARARPGVDSFDEATQAAARMSAAWEDLLNGKQDLEALRLALVELRELTAAARALVDAAR